MADRPSPPWKLQCPWCGWHLIVSARGQRGNDPGSGVEAALLGQRHAASHNRTWQEFLSPIEGGDET
jgi:hypothetical protein